MDNKLTPSRQASSSSSIKLQINDELPVSVSYLSEEEQQDNCNTSPLLTEQGSNNSSHCDGEENTIPSQQVVLQVLILLPQYQVQTKQHP